MRCQAPASGRPLKTPAWLVARRRVLPSGRRTAAAVAPVWLTGPRSCQALAAPAFSVRATRARASRRFAASMARQSYPGAARWRRSIQRSNSSRSSTGRALRRLSREGTWGEVPAVRASESVRVVSRVTERVSIMGLEYREPEGWSRPFKERRSFRFSHGHSRESIGLDHQIRISVLGQHTPHQPDATAELLDVAKLHEPAGDRRIAVVRMAAKLTFTCMSEGTAGI